MRDGGDRSASGKCLSKSSTCVIDNGEVFSVTLVLIVSPGEKNIYFTEAMRFLAFRLQYFVIWAQSSVHEEFTMPREFKVLLRKFLQIPLNDPDVLAVLSSRKHNSYCIISSTKMMACLNTVRRNVATKFFKDI